MSPQRGKATAARDAALERRRRLLIASGIGGLTAVGALTGVLASAAATSASASQPSSGSTGSAAAQPGDSQPGSSQGSLNPPQSAPGGITGGGVPQAVTGGSGHR